MEHQIQKNMEYTMESASLQGHEGIVLNVGATKKMQTIIHWGTIDVGTNLTQQLPRLLRNILFGSVAS